MLEISPPPRGRDRAFTVQQVTEPVHENTQSNPPFQDKKCENGSLLLFEIGISRLKSCSACKFSPHSNFHIHVYLYSEIMAMERIRNHKGFGSEINV